MRQLYFHCLIRRDAVETVHRDAASSEVPVLQAVYGDNLVVGESHVAEREPLEPSDEFERLAKRYGEQAVIAAYGTRFAAEREIAKLFADPAAQVAATSTGAKADSSDPFLTQGADAIIEKLPEIADDELAAYLEAEQAAKKPRKTVVAAMQAELQARADEDAAEAANKGGTAQ